MGKLGLYPNWIRITYYLNLRTIKKKSLCALAATGRTEERYRFVKFVKDDLFIINDKTLIGEMEWYILI